MASVSIKRGTKQVIDNTSLKDGRLYFTTDQPINKIYTDIPNGQGGLERITIGGGTEVDSELSTTSTNPVQNKVITEEVDDVRGQIHTNLLNPTLETTTINGVTCTNNGDGTYTLNGTATGWGIFDLECNVNLKKGQTYKLTGCPKGGSSSTYRLGIYTEPSTFIAQDTGNGIEYTPTEDGVKDLHIVIHPQQVVENLVFKPMLTTDLSADYNSFVKYSGSEERLNEQVASLHESSKGVITNLLNPTLPTMTKNGVTCTSNGDGTYTLNGTATSNTFFHTVDSIGLEVGARYRICGCPKGGGDGVFKVGVYRKSNNVQMRMDTGNGATFTADETPVDVSLVVYSGKTVTNLTFKPMLTTDLDATYNDYVPYSGDGRLNENVAEIYDKVEEHTDEIAQINSDLSDISNEVNLKGERNVIGIISKVYYGSYQALVFLPKAKDFNITVTDLYAGVGNSDVHITNFSTSKYDNGVRITFTSSTDVSGCLATATFTIS